MTIGEKRQVLYAALLRHSPEAESLRERVLDRLVLIALLESSHSQPMRIGNIQTLTRVDPQSPGLRTEVIQDTLNRLISRNKVGHELLKTKHTYYLTDTGRSDTNEATESAILLFEPVLARMLQDTSALLCDERDGVIVFRTFISECFARFGQQIARAVTGEITKNQLIDAADIRGAFQAAISSVSLSDDAIQSLEMRCIRFLRSTERDDEELKFRLAQGYYVAQLLGLNTYEFNPIADDAFRGAVFYIDTNVLVGRLLSDERARLFDELVHICNTLVVDLRVSRATINEVRWVAAGRLKGLEKVLTTVPSELVSKTRDEFLDAFLKIRNSSPEVTAEQFLARFDEIPNLLENLGIELDDRTAEEIIGDRDVDRECEIVHQAAAKTRGRGKSKPVCLHDVCHQLLIQEERRSGRKAWFLTLDKTLSQAAIDLGGDQPPFFFPLAGFLQSVSPFLEAPEVQRSLVDLFSAVLDGEIGDLSGESLFNLSELKIISEFHTDVFSTPVEQLVPAFDHVKSNVLSGKLYQRDDHTKVALELKKFLAASGEAKQKALQAEAIRLTNVVAAERAKREDAEEDTKKQQAEVSRLRAEVAEAIRLTNVAAAERAKREDAEEDAKKQQAEVSRLRAEVQKAGKRQVSDARREGRLRAGFAVLGALLTAGVWAFDSELAAATLRALGLGTSFDVLLRPGVRLMGAAILVGSFFPAVRSLKPTYRIGALSVIMASAAGGLNLLGSAVVASISGYLAIGATIALAFMIVVEWSRVVRRDET